jgi:hypothetical protein
VLQFGIPWETLPQEMGYGSGMSCWRRLRDWQQHVYRSMIWVYADNVALCRSTINRVIALALRETRAIVS